MAYISNMEERALALLAGQFRGTNPDGTQTNFQRLISSFVASAQDLEDTIQQLRSQRNLDTAVGVQLDGLGEILGLERSSGETDSNYRERLKFQIFINESTGTPEELIKALAFLTDASEVIYFESYPASYQMSTNGTTFPNPHVEIISAITSMAPAGVGGAVITATYGVDVPFVFARDGEIELLWVTDPSDPSVLDNLQLDTTDLLYVDRASTIEPNEGGGFAEYGSPNIDTTGAGQISELFI